MSIHNSSAALGMILTADKHISLALLSSNSPLETHRNGLMKAFRRKQSSAKRRHLFPEVPEPLIL